MVDLSLGATPCSRKEISVSKLFLIRKRGARVITLVSLYFPYPSDQERPAWISADLMLWDGTTIDVSAAGASKLKVFMETMSSYRLSSPDATYLRPVGVAEFENEFMTFLVWVR